MTLTGTRHWSPAGSPEAVYTHVQIAMINKWFKFQKLPLSIEQFHQLPQNAAFKYEYIGGEAWLTPRPKSYNALLDLRSFEAPIPLQAEDPIVVRPLASTDWDVLPSVVSAAFHRVQPFASLDNDVRLGAASECIGQTIDGEEGPLVHDACFVAARRDDESLVGAALVTLALEGDLSDFRARETPPPDAVVQGIGRPHLTWIFVAPFHARFGIGAALLEAAAGALTRLGYNELASTFLVGNESSTLWHWRMGFRVQPYPGSERLIHERVRTERKRDIGS